MPIQELPLFKKEEYVSGLVKIKKDCENLKNKKKLFIKNILVEKLKAGMEKIIQILEINGVKNKRRSI